MPHIPVLLQEAVDALKLVKSSRVLDATFGGGGYSKAIARVIGKSGKLYATDADSEVFTDELVTGLNKKCQFHFAVENFKYLAQTLDRMSAGELDAAVFDLGVSSMQLDSRRRGFSFRFEEPLLMTFAKSPNKGDVTAEIVVNTWSEETLREILRGFAEERFAPLIARAIVSHRTEKRITSTNQLAEIVAEATPLWHRKKSRVHPATKTFQAIRMAVNQELDAINSGIPAAFSRLRIGGRLAVVTFHSIEDRAVKILFRSLADAGDGILINKKPITPIEEEQSKNPRSRSAKLRIIEKKAP